MRPSKTLAPLPALLAALAVLVVAGPAFARGGIDRQAGQAAFVKGSYRAGQAHCLRIAGSRPVHLVVLGRMPEGDVVDGDVVDGKRLRLIGARGAVVMARDLNRIELVERNRARLKRYKPRQFGRYLGVM